MCVGYIMSTELRLLYIPSNCCYMMYGEWYGSWYGSSIPYHTNYHTIPYHTIPKSGVDRVMGVRIPQLRFA